MWRTGNETRTLYCKPSAHSQVLQLKRSLGVRQFTFQPSHKAWRSTGRTLQCPFIAVKGHGCRPFVRSLQPRILSALPGRIVQKNSAEQILPPSPSPPPPFSFLPPPASTPIDKGGTPQPPASLGDVPQRYTCRSSVGIVWQGSGRWVTRCRKPLKAPH